MVPQVVSQERLNIVTQEVAEAIGKPLRKGLCAGLLRFN
jgi:hypothetical protein